MPVVVEPVITERKIDVERGFYLLNSLTEEQRVTLEQNGYSLHKSRLMKSGGSAYFLVRRQGKESSEHALFCWYVADEIRKRGGKPTVNATVEADVTVRLNGKKICFEVETGESLASFGLEYIDEKIQQRKKNFDLVYIIVTDRLLKRKYQRISEAITITRAEIPEALDQLKNRHT